MILFVPRISWPRFGTPGVPKRGASGEPVSRSAARIFWGRGQDNGSVLTGNGPLQRRSRQLLLVPHDKNFFWSHWDVGGATCCPPIPGTRCPPIPETCSSESSLCSYSSRSICSSLNNSATPRSLRPLAQIHIARESHSSARESHRSTALPRSDAPQSFEFARSNERLEPCSVGLTLYLSSGADRSSLDLQHRTSLKNHNKGDNCKGIFDLPRDGKREESFNSAVGPFTNECSTYPTPA